MQRLLAIAWLTWKAALRFRLFWVIAALLLGAVVGLPLLIKDDGTARGFTQILITYTLSTITALLGLSTLWLACGTLARDIEDCQMQVVATKPISRWQIWFGKWLGLVSLNAVLLAVSGGAVYCLLLYRATRLPADQQRILRNEVLVARGSVTQKDFSKDIDQQTDLLLRQRMAKNPVGQVDLPEVRKQIREQVKSELEIVQPSYMRQWELDLGAASKTLRDRPLQLRIKFNAADKSPSGTFQGVWRIGVPRRTQLWESELMSLAPETIHEFPIPPNLFDDKGLLTVTFGNPNNTALLFPLEDGIEVLYRESGFGVNFLRGFIVIFCWMSLLAALGLSAASLLSFPVAAFLSLAVLAMTLSTGTLSGAVSEGTIGGYDAEKGPSGRLPIDVIVIPMFKAILKVINLAKDFSPVDSLSTGRSVTWRQVGMAFVQIILMLSGILAAIGISIFNRRELATAQGTS